MTEPSTLQSSETTQTKTSESSASPTTSYKYAPPPAIRIGSKLTPSPSTLESPAQTNGYDPKGIPQHAPGAKLDGGKNRLDLVLGEFAEALWEVGEVGTYGASKYTPRGWLSVPDAGERYRDALLRHYLQYRGGEARDRESQLLHLAHLAWNALAVLQLELKNNKNAAPNTSA